METSRRELLKSMASSSPAFSFLMTGGELFKKPIAGEKSGAGACSMLSVKDFGASGDGVTDDTPAIQAAIDRAHELGGALVCMDGLDGRNFRCDSPLSLDDKSGVQLFGATGPAGPPSTQLFYSGVDSPFISMRSSFSITLRNLRVAYSNSQFMGDLIKTGHSAANQDSQYCLFEGCWFTGMESPQTAINAASLINMDRMIVSTVRNCVFQDANVGIRGRNFPCGATGCYTNAIQIRDCSFESLNSVAIADAGEAWLISGCTFEALRSGRSGAYRQARDGFSWGLTFIGCWMGDVTQPGGNWIDTGPLGALGLAIIGNRIAPAGTGPSDTCLKVAGEGISIMGNRLEGPVSIDIQSVSRGVFIGGNDFQHPILQFPAIRNMGNVRFGCIAGNNNLVDDANLIQGEVAFDRGVFRGIDGRRAAMQLVPGGIPTNPQEGDLWIVNGPASDPNAGLFVRIGGQTRRVVLS